MKKIKITITMTEEEARWLEQLLFIEDDYAWSKFFRRIANVIRRAINAF